jgi:hypothetical protein
MPSPIINCSSTTKNHQNTENQSSKISTTASLDIATQQQQTKQQQISPNFSFESSENISNKNLKHSSPSNFEQKQKNLFRFFFSFFFIIFCFKVVLLILQPKQYLQMNLINKNCLFLLIGKISL